MQEPKPGYETTEFWTTIVVSAIGVLLAAGVISPAQASAAQQQAATWAGALVVLATVITYIVGHLCEAQRLHRSGEDPDGPGSRTRCSGGYSGRQSPRAALWPRDASPDPSPRYAFVY